MSHRNYYVLMFLFYYRKIVRNILLIISKLTQCRLETKPKIRRVLIKYLKQFNSQKWKLETEDGFLLRI